MNNITGRSALSDRTNSAGGAKDRRALLAEWKTKAKSRGGSENGGSTRSSLLSGGVRRTGLGGGVARVTGGAGSKVRKSKVVPEALPSPPLRLLSHHN